MQSQFHSPPLTKINKTIIIASVALFVLSAILEKVAGMSITSLLALKTKAIFSGHIYQLATYPFVERSFFAILFNCLIIWFIGSDLEGHWGKKLYLQFLTSCITATAFIYIIVTGIFLRDGLSMSFPLFGLSTVCYGLLGAYAIIYADRYLSFMFLFPIKAIWFCILLGGIQLYQAIFSTYAKSAWAHLAGLIFGILFLRIKAFMINRSRNAAAKKKEKLRKNSHLHIVRPDDEDDKPKYWH